MRSRTIAWIVLVVAFLVLFVLLPMSAGFTTDFLWFANLGFSSIFWKVTLTKIAVFFVFALLFGTIFFANLHLARHISPPRLLYRGQFNLLELGIIRWGMVLITVFFSLVMGGQAGTEWDTILRFFNYRPFDATDPIFGKDLGFYIFQLPLYSFLRGWLLGTLVLTGLGVGMIVILSQVESLSRRQGLVLNPRLRVHFSVLGAAILLLIAWGYWLDGYGILYSTRSSIFYGATYTDVNAKLLALRLLFGIACFCAVALLGNVFVRGVLLPSAGVGLWAITAILAGWLYPSLVQSFIVKPNEPLKEAPYIQHNINHTLKAYGLDTIQEVEYPARGTLTYASLKDNETTIRNIRLWDYRPLRDSYRQLQALRSYYEFADVDIDRYDLDGQYRQLMLAARELVSAQIPSRNWATEHLLYTHGYGLAASPVNEVTAEGQPVLYIKDFPPQSPPGLEITRPEIYYGERTESYVLVKTTQPEFNYPKGDQDVMTTYEGEGGVKLDSSLKRLLFAYRFGDMNLALSRYLTNESRIMLYRNIHQRVQKVAPFLLYDRDPYIVILDGKLYWIQDAYTYTNRYPYSKPYGEGHFNYIRNSIKVVIGPYDGRMAFYIVDPTDPLASAYAGMFPALFTSGDQMPAGLKAHLRYPEDLFTIQASVYSTYHMREARNFYKQEDPWSIPYEVYLEKKQPIEPYYIIMRLPGQEKEEFLLMRPFTPLGKDNMIAWMAARCDGANYGKILVYRFPKERQPYGPLQIEASIDQDDIISFWLTNWSQKGSQVLRGNLLVIPMDDALLYVKPIYLQAETAQRPELKRVIVTYGERVAMEMTLERALAVALGTAPPASTSPSPGLVTLPGTRSNEELINAAHEHYTKAQEALRAGDWAAYGREQEALGQVLEELKGQSSRGN